MGFGIDIDDDIVDDDDDDDDCLKQRSAKKEWLGHKVYDSGARKHAGEKSVSAPVPSCLVFLSNEA